MTSITNLPTTSMTDIISTSTKPKAWVRPRAINQNIKIMSTFNEMISGAICNQRDVIYQEVLEETGDEAYARFCARDWNPVI